MSFEALLVSKLRAGRPQDIEDLQALCRLKAKEIQWDLVGSLASATEVQDIKNAVSAVSS